MRPLRAAALVWFFAVSLGVGCNSLFGIQDGVLAGDSGAADDATTPDASVDSADASSSDRQVSGEATADVAGQDADAGPLRTLACTTWRYPQPFMVANSAAYVGQCGTNYQTVDVFSSDSNTLRIVAAQCSPAPVFTVYSVDKTQSPLAVTSVDLPYASSGQVWSVIRLDGGFGIVTSTTVGGIESVVLYPFLDANPITPLPQPIPIAQLQETTTTYQDEVAVLQVSSSAYFVVTESTSTNTPGTFVSTGLAAAGQQANMMQIDTVTGLFTPILAHVGSSVFIYVAQQSPPASFYQVPDTATTGSTRKNIAPLDPLSYSSQFIDAVPGSAPNTTNLAYVEFDSADGGQFGGATFRASPVGNAALPSLTAAGVAFGKTYTDFGSVPAPLSAFHFFGDDFVTLGPGEMANQDPTTWINFLWLNANGVVRSDQSGLNGLLSGHAPYITTIAASPSGNPAASSGAWNIAWAEGVPADGGSYEVLYLNELDCK